MLGYSLAVFSLSRSVTHSVNHAYYVQSVCSTLYSLLLQAQPARVMSDWDRATEESGITAGCPVTGHTLYTTQLLGISCSDVN